MEMVREESGSVEPNISEALQCASHNAYNDRVELRARPQQMPALKDTRDHMHGSVGIDVARVVVAREQTGFAT